RRACHAQERASIWGHGSAFRRCNSTDSIVARRAAQPPVAGRNDILRPGNVEARVFTRLRFTNFKAWRDSGEIRLAPLTVLFGANSAGKTSIPQLLLLLKQTADSPDRRRVLQLGDSRSGLDLGSYDDVVHHHETERPLEIDLHWRLADPLA